MQSNYRSLETFGEQEGQNQTFSSGFDQSLMKAMSKLKGNQQQQLESPQFLDNNEDLIIQQNQNREVEYPPSLLKYKNILEKIQKDHSINNANQKQQQQQQQQSVQNNDDLSNIKDNASNKQKVKSFQIEDDDHLSDLSQSALSFDKELNKKLRELDNKKKEISQRSGAVSQDQSQADFSNFVKVPSDNSKNKQLIQQQQSILSKQSNQSQSIKVDDLDNNIKKSIKQNTKEILQPMIQQKQDKDQSINSNKQILKQMNSQKAVSTASANNSISNQQQKSVQSINNKIKQEDQEVLTTQQQQLLQQNSLWEELQQQQQQQENNEALGSQQQKTKRKLDFNNNNNQGSNNVKVQAYLNNKQQFEQKITEKDNNWAEQEEYDFENEQFQVIIPKSQQRQQLQRNKFSNDNEDEGYNDQENEEEPGQQMPTAELGNAQNEELLEEDLVSNSASLVRPEEILRNNETVKFLRKYFLNSEDQSIKCKIRFTSFVQCIYQEFKSYFTGCEQESLAQFEENLKSLVTTNSEHFISFNALEILTKELGLASKISELAKEAEYTNKRSKNESVNSQIIEELSSVKQMLDKRKVELDSRDLEQQKQQIFLQELEQKLMKREEDLKMILKGEYDVMVYSLEEACKEKLMQINKKALAIEKNLKSKIQIVQTKAKETKQVSQQKSSQEDKLKSKIISLEKSNEFLKIKSMDSEKKLQEEKNITILLQNTNETQKDKIQQLENKMKEILQQNQVLQQQQKLLLQKSQSQIRSSVSLKKIEEPPQTAEEDFEEDYQERDIIDNQKFYQNLEFQGQNRLNLMISDQKDNDQLSKKLDLSDLQLQPSPIKLEENKLNDQTINEITSVLKPEVQVIQQQHVNNKLNTLEQPQTKDFQKKTTGATKKKTAGGTSVGSDEDSKILINIIHYLINCLKTTLPIFLHYNNNNNTNDVNQKESKQQLQQQQFQQQNQLKNCKVDIGEILFPDSSHLITNIIDLAPSLLTKPYLSRPLYSVIEVLFKVINFNLRLSQGKVNTILPEETLQTSKNLTKSQQDHINEVMCSQRSPNEMAFLPQSTYWKKKLKAAQKNMSSNTSSLAYQRQQLQQQSQQQQFQKKSNRDSTNLNLITGSNQSNPLLTLFGEEISKEIVLLIKSFIDHSELLIRQKSGAGGNSAQQSESQQQPALGINSNNASVLTFSFVPENKNIENQKFILMSRINLNLIALTLTYNKQDCIIALRNLNADLNTGSEPLNEYLKKFVIDNDAVNIVITKMYDCRIDTLLVTFSLELLLNFSCNGSHYQQFIIDISTEDCVTKMFDLFEFYIDRLELCEKISVIVQRITYHNNLRGSIAQKWLQMLQQKLTQVENMKDQEFLVSNLASILKNLEQ